MEALTASLNERGPAAAPGRAAESPLPDVLQPNSAFMRQVLAETGMNLGGCFGCKKCSNGCPLTFAMDLHPYQVVRLAQLGQKEVLESCRTIWICASCQSCLTRCPNEIDLPRLMDWLKERVVKDSRPVEETKTLIFHQAFLRQVAKRGRVFEAGMMAHYLLKTNQAFGPAAIANARLGLAMLKRGRLKLLPRGNRDRRWLGPLFLQQGGEL